MANEKPITLALLDDEPMERSLLAYGLERSGDFSLMLCCGCGSEGVEAAAAVPPPDLALVGFPHGGLCATAPAVLSWVHTHWQRTPVMVLLDELSVEGIQCAAPCCHGYLSRATDDLERTHHGLHRLYLERGYVPPEVVRALAQPPPPESELAFTLRVLNETQRRILDAVCAPDEPKWTVVAERVSRSTGCVEENATLMYQLLDVKGKPGLVAYGRPLGFGQGRYC